MAVSLLEEREWFATTDDAFSTFCAHNFFAVSHHGKLRVVADMPVFKVLLDATPRAGALESGTVNLVLGKPKDPAFARVAVPQDIVVTRKYEIRNAGDKLECVFNMRLHAQARCVKYYASD